MTEHTPAPWRLEKRYDPESGEDAHAHMTFAPYITDSAGRNIAVAMIGGVEPDEFRANARLIAAAPVLLAALEEIAKGEGRFSFDPLTHAANTIEHMRVLARAAIAAARGEVRDA